MNQITTIITILILGTTSTNLQLTTVKRMMNSNNNIRLSLPNVLLLRRDIILITALLMAMVTLMMMMMTVMMEMEMKMKLRTRTFTPPPLQFSLNQPYR